MRKPTGRPRGRPPGSPNKRSLEIADRLAELGCDPIAGMALIASGEVPCGTCHASGKTRYRIPGTDKVGERLCESCYGTLLEKVTPQLRGQMYAELAQYVAPKRKAIEHSAAEGQDIPTWVVVRPQPKTLPPTPSKSEKDLQ